MSKSAQLLPEIQGLRAIAVGLVVIFHIWPTALTGGFVGVDVFFVVSGYLISGLLMRAAERGDLTLLDFYARRARRLLPAALLVLAASLVGSWIFLPDDRWIDTAVQIAASALYVQNWALAHLAVDYWAADAAPSPVQHYWSLSIEEQFYLVWPILMLATATVAKWRRWPLRAAATLFLAAIFVVSLVASIVGTADDQASAYFFTHTRVWELALGGLLSVGQLDRLPIAPRIRAVGGVFGLIAIFVSAASFSQQTPFPGTAALLPTVGAALVLLAGTRLPVVSYLFANPVMRFIGDRSYSIYLWHWPIIVFYNIDNLTLSLFEGLLIAGFTLVISHLSYLHVEERFRHPSSARKDDWAPIRNGALATAVIAALAWSSQVYVGQTSQEQIAMAVDNYPGPLSLTDGVAAPADVDPIPSLALLRKDRPDYVDECHQDQESAEPISCVLGDPDGTRTMAIFGDSHAAHWVPALDEIAKAGGWRLLTYTKSACSYARMEVMLLGQTKPYPSCREWRENVLAKLREVKPDAVITAQSRGYSARKAASGAVDVWKELAGMGAQVIAVDDTPWLKFDPGDCLEEPEDGCRSSRTVIESPKTMKDALAKAPITNVRVIDMTDYICGKDTCSLLTGNIIVYRDRHHLTATYARALAKQFAAQANLSMAPLMQ